MNLGKGIAVAGIWIGVGLIGLGGGGGPAACAAIFAFFATAIVCS